MRAQCVLTHRMSSAIGLLSLLHSRGGGHRIPAADRRTIHHLPKGCKTLFDGGLAGLEDAADEFHCVARIMLTPVFGPTLAGSLNCIANFS